MKKIVNETSTNPNFQQLMALLLKENYNKTIVDYIRKVEEVIDGERTYICLSAGGQSALNCMNKKNVTELKTLNNSVDSKILKIMMSFENIEPYLLVETQMNMEKFVKPERHVAVWRQIAKVYSKYLELNPNTYNLGRNRIFRMYSMNNIVM